MNFQLTIIVPVFNEEDNLLRLEKALLSFIKNTDTPSTVLFVNDGSTDGSQSIIDNICSKNDVFNFIQFTKNEGLSAALKAGFDHTTTSLVGYIDADLQTSPEDFNRLFEHIEDYAMVTGVRQNRQDDFIKKATSRTANTGRRLFTKDGMDDTGCPLKIIKTDYAKRLPMFKGLHRFLPALIQLQNGRVKQVPVRHFPRVAGTSKYGLWSRFASTITDCFAYLWIKNRTIDYHIKSQRLKQPK